MSHCRLAGRGRLEGVLGPPSPRIPESGRPLPAGGPPLSRRPRDPSFRPLLPVDQEWRPSSCRGFPSTQSPSEGDAASTTFPESPPPRRLGATPRLPPRSPVGQVSAVRDAQNHGPAPVGEKIVWRRVDAQPGTLARSQIQQPDTPLLTRKCGSNTCISGSGSAKRWTPGLGAKRCQPCTARRLSTRLSAQVDSGGIISLIDG